MLLKLHMEYGGVKNYWNIVDIWKIKTKAKNK